MGLMGSRLRGKAPQRTAVRGLLLRLQAQLLLVLALQITLPLLRLRARAPLRKRLQ